MIKLTINGKTVEIEEGATIMEAAAKAGIKIPSLCHLKDVHTYGSCRICVVEVDGMKNLQASCIRPSEGLLKLQQKPELRTPGAGL